MKDFQAVIFDLDGVIVDSEPRHERAFLEVFRELGYGDTHGMNFPEYYGRSDMTLWVDFVAKHQPPHSLDDLNLRKQRRFLEIIRRDEPIFAGLPGLVEKLAARCSLAVASGSQHPVIDAVLAMRQLRRFFPVTVSSSDVKHGKPAPDIFLRAAELLGADPGACWVIEDSVAGVEAAHAAGMSVVAITNTFPAAELSRATQVVRTYAEIEAILLG